MTNIKRTNIKKAVSDVMTELNCSLIDAVSKMQIMYLRQRESQKLRDLCEFKFEVITAACPSNF